MSALAETLAAGRIIDVMTGGKFDWRSRLDESDFLESGDWLTALAYARAALTDEQTLSAELLAALEPFAKLELPPLPEGNAGMWSILHADIARAHAAVALARAA